MPQTALSIQATNPITAPVLVAESTTMAFNQTVAGVIKVGGGRLSRVVIQAPGTTGGAFTLNDCATIGAAAAANQLWSAPFNGTGIVAGGVIILNLPFKIGLVLSAVPTAGSPVCAISYG